MIEKNRIHNPSRLPATPHVNRKTIRLILRGLETADAYARFFNAFLFHLPSHEGDSMLEVGLYRAREAHQSAGEIFYLQEVMAERSLPFFQRSGCTISQLRAMGYSDKFIGQTVHPLKTDVLRAISQCSLTLRPVRDMVSQFYSGKKISIKQYQEIITPIYARLREMGYSYTDLTRGGG